jgi:hypothetical protein
MSIEPGIEPGVNVFCFLTADFADKHGYGEQKQTKETKIVGRWKETLFSSSWRQRSQSFTLSKSIVPVVVRVSCFSCAPRPSD